MEGLELLDVSLVKSPRLSSIQQRAKYHDVVDFHLVFSFRSWLDQTLLCSLPKDALAFAMRQLISASSCPSFAILQVGENIGHFQCCIFHGDLRLEVDGSWHRLVEDFCLLNADSEVK